MDGTGETGPSDDYNNLILSFPFSLSWIKRGFLVLCGFLQKQTSVEGQHGRNILEDLVNDNGKWLVWRTKKIVRFIEALLLLTSTRQELKLVLAR